MVPTVLTVTVATRPVPNFVELPGRIEAVRSAEIRARVDGIVERRLFTEGADVASGTALFLIDPRDMRAQLQQARAGLDTAQAARRNAASMVSRFSPLVNRKAISAQEYETALSGLQQAEASVRNAKASVERAELQLSYTTVRAPIAGRVGRAQVSEGALVSAAGATLMAQVDQLSPIFATFSQASAEVLDLTQQITAGVISLPDNRRVEVRLIKENGQDYGITGHLDFAEQRVDPSTGSQMFRAQFPNPARLLLPGQFVRGVITAGMIQNGVVVPQRAVQFAGEEASLMTVSSDGTVARRVVTLGGQNDGQWIIRTGLKPGEHVIVDGWQKVQPGMKVKTATAPSEPKKTPPASTPPAP